MEQRISFITLAVEHVARNRKFYVVGPGWKPMFGNDEVIMLRAGEYLMLSLWSAEGFTAEIATAPARGVAPITLSHNCATEKEVITCSRFLLPSVPMCHQLFAGNGADTPDISPTPTDSGGKLR